MAKKRSSGEGTLKQLPSGNWRAQVSLKGRRLSHTAKNQQAAREWIRSMQGQIEQGLTYDDEHTTVGKFLEGWLASKKNELRIRSAELYTWIVKDNILPALGTIRLKDLSAGKVQGFYDQLSASGKSPQTINSIRIIFHMGLEHAKNIGLVGRNPSEFCRVPKGNKQKMSIWTEEQVNQFLGYIRGHKNENLYYLALGTGMRRGELLGLKWQDVDWANQRVIVRQQLLNPVGGGFIFQAPKSANGVRSVQLGLGLVERLKAQLAQVDLYRRMSTEKWQEFDIVFPARTGLPQYANGITIEFSALVKRSGLPRIRFHDCRHTAASILLSHGIPPMIVAEMLGHSMSTLMSTYAHFIPGRQEEAARLMDQVITPIEVKFDQPG